MLQIQNVCVSSTNQKNQKFFLAYLKSIMYRVADRITNYLLARKVIRCEEYDIYHYGVVSGTELLFCLFINLALAVRIDCLPEFLIFSISFASLRSFTGGVHMKTYISCFLCTTLLVHAILLISSRCLLTIPILLVCYVCSTIVILAVISRQVKEQNTDEMVYFKKKVVKILLVNFIAFVIFMLLDKREYTSVLALAVFVIVAAMLPAISK